jgi:hypothetical protein
MGNAERYIARPLHLLWLVADEKVWTLDENLRWDFQKPRSTIPSDPRFCEFPKPYEGELYRPSGTLEKIRFYDEREWRFLPELPKDFVPLFLTKEQFMNWGMRTQANLKLADICRLSFEPKDIRYLVLRQEEEIVPLTNQIEQIKIKYSPDDVRLLKTRVITAEQIRSDF